MYCYWSSVTWPVSDCTVSYRPVLSSERASYRKNSKAIVTRERIRIKSSHGPQGGSRYQDELVDWPSAVRQTQLNSKIASWYGPLFSELAQCDNVPFCSHDRTRVAFVGRLHLATLRHNTIWKQGYTLSSLGFIKSMDLKWHCACANLCFKLGKTVAGTLVILMEATCMMQMWMRMGEVLMNSLNDCERSEYLLVSIWEENVEIRLYEFPR
jgi:hypothetical protein